MLLMSLSILLRYGSVQDSQDKIGIIPIVSGLWLHTKILRSRIITDQGYADAVSLSILTLNE